MVDVFQGQKKLVFMIFPRTSFLFPGRSKPAIRGCRILVKRGPLSLSISAATRAILTVIDLGKSNLGVSVDVRLLIDPANAFDGVDVISAELAPCIPVHLDLTPEG